MTIHLMQAVAAKGFTLICHFSGGEIVEYDMSDIRSEAGSIAAPLKKPSFFSKVFIESGTPTWPNGYDVSSELIYREGKRIKSGSSLLTSRTKKR
jgi:hypothetical protein